jgi:carbamoyl-phosphate synthase large subunit
VTTVLLTGAGGSAAANVADALRLAGGGYRIVGVDVNPVNLHLSTADERVLVPRADDPGYPAALARVVERFGADVLHPQPDPDVRAIGEIRHLLAVRTFMPEQPVLSLVADKARFAHALSSAGVAAPAAVGFESADDVTPGVERLLADHERVWIRARTGAGARASLPVSTAAQAVHWIAWWVSERGLHPSDFMASEMLPGREFAYQSVWQDGALVAGQARERLVYLYGHLTPHGQTSTPAVARTVCEPAVDAVAAAAIRAVDPSPRGAYCVDIKESADGRPMVTEINAGRFFTTSNFFAHAGLNMPDILVRCALGEQVTGLPSSPLEPDLYWVRMVDMGYRLVRGEELHAWPSAVA